MNWIMTLVEEPRELILLFKLDLGLHGLQKFLSFIATESAFYENDGNEGSEKTDRDSEVRVKLDGIGQPLAEC